MKLLFERLEHNNHPTPTYATVGSAAFDFRACLTRTCKKVVEGGLVEFQVRGPRRYYENAPNDLNKAELIIAPRETILIPTGFKTAFKDAVLKLYIRSSLGIKNLVLANGTGIIDSDYRGELFLAIFNMSEYYRHIYDGDRIAQGILEPCVQATLEEGVVDQTARGEGGFGSTN